MKLYVLLRNCGDYYCACGGGHVVGIFTERPEAEDFRDKVVEVTVDEARWDPMYWVRDADGPGWT